MSNDLRALAWEIAQIGVAVSFGFWIGLCAPGFPAILAASAVATTLHMWCDTRKHAARAHPPTKETDDAE